MSPFTHFLTGWVLANAVDLNRRDRAIVTIAAVVPDVDGLGIVAEILTRHSQHPLLWFSDYHHALHTFLFALVVFVGAFLISTRKWISATLALVASPRPPRAPRRQIAASGFPVPCAPSVVFARVHLGVLP